MRRQRGDDGQATSEYLMIAGLLTAVIMTIRWYVYPTFWLLIWFVMKTTALYLTSDPGN